MSCEQTVRYVLRFPFELDGNHDISGLEEAFSRSLNSLTLRLNRSGRFYVLTIDGFESPDAAKDFTTSVWAGLTWALLNRGVAFRAVLEPRDVVFPEDPVEAAKNVLGSSGIELNQPLDGLADGNAPCVYPSDKHVWVIAPNPVTVQMGVPVEQFFEYFVEGLAATNSHAVVSDIRLRTALELYRTHFTETSLQARLLTLVMALECLTIKSDKHSVVLELIAKWQAEIKDSMKAHDSASEPHFSGSSD